MLTALLIQARADVHTNTHTNAQRCGARARQNSNIFVFPSRTLAAEREKKNQKDCRLEKKEAFAEESERQGKTNGRNQAEVRREIGKIQNFIYLYLAITGTLQKPPKCFLILRHYRTLAIKNTSNPECAFLHIATGRYVP